MAQLLRRRMEDDDATDFSTEWGSANVGYAIAVSIGAGLATGLGGCLVFFPKFFRSIPQSMVLGVSLALSAGVMLYVHWSITGRFTGPVTGTLPVNGLLRQ